ncbi:MAG: acyltransferase [Planctomycetota bacterium]
MLAWFGLRRKPAPPFRGPGVARSARVRHPEKVRIDPTASVGEGVVLVGGQGAGVDVGLEAQVNYYAVVLGGAGVSIGARAMVGPHCVLAAGNHDFRHPTLPARFAPGVSRGPIRLEEDVWLGSHVTVTDGVTIGRGAVIGAGSVVTHDVPAGMVAVGSPAKVVRAARDEPLAQAA